MANSIGHHLNFGQQCSSNGKESATHDEESPNKDEESMNTDNEIRTNDVENMVNEDENMINDDENMANDDEVVPNENNILPNQEQRLANDEPCDLSVTNDENSSKHLDNHENCDMVPSNNDNLEIHHVPFQSGLLATDVRFREMELMNEEQSIHGDRLIINEEQSAANGEQRADNQGPFMCNHKLFFSDFGLLLDSPLPCKRMEWQIPDILKLHQEAVVRLRSRLFAFAGAEWCLHLYPNGSSGSDRQWMELYLVRVNSSVFELPLRFKLGVKYKDGTVGKVFSSTMNFNWDDYGYGTVELLQRRQLQEIPDIIAPQGIFTVFCEMHLQDIKRTADVACQADTFSGTDKLVNDYIDILHTGEGSDVQIVVGERKFRVHQSILRARSPVFSAMLTGRIEEKCRAVLYIPNIDPGVFDNFLHYVYSAHVKREITSDNVLSLFDMAVRYEIKDLLLSCTEHMKAILCVETFSAIAVVSLKHRETTMFSELTSFFAQNAAEIVKTERWQRVMEEYPKEANEMFMRLIVPEVLTEGD